MGAMNAYVAAAVQLAGALAEEGRRRPRSAAPRARARRCSRRSAAVLLVPLAFDVIGVDGLVRACSAAFVAVYVAATAAGVRLLDGAARVAAGVAFVAVAVVFAFSGVYLAVPAVVGVAAAVRRPRWPSGPRVRRSGGGYGTGLRARYPPLGCGRPRRRRGRRRTRRRRRARGSGRAPRRRRAGGRERRLGPERPRVHEQPGGVRLGHERGRLAEPAVRRRAGSPGPCAGRSRPRRPRSRRRPAARPRSGARAGGVAAQRAQVAGLEGLDEHRPAEPVERGQQRRLERQPERGEVRRVLGLGVDADAGARGERDDLVERRDPEAAVERGPAQLGQPLARARSVRSSASVKSSVNQPSCSRGRRPPWPCRRSANSGRAATSVVPEISFSWRATSARRAWRPRRAR